MVALAARHHRAGSPRVLAFDDFSEADGTAVVGKVADTGQLWVAKAQVGIAGFTITGGKAFPSSDLTGSGGERWALVDVGTPDMRVAATVRLGSTANRIDVGLMARATTASVSGFLFALSDLDDTGLDRLYKVYRYAGGGVAVLAAGAGGQLVVGGTYAAELRCKGSTISAWLNGVQVASVTDANNAGNTLAGIRYYPGTAGENGQSSFDDFMVTAL